MSNRDLYTIVRPASGQGLGPPPLLVLLHGLGSNEEDLMGFAPLIPARFVVASIRAPYPYEWGGYAWFRVEFGPEGCTIDAAQAVESRDAVIQTLPQLESRLGTAPGETILGGFSQGAMLSLGVAMARPGIAKRLLLMSGVLPPFFDLDANLNGLDAFVTHGTHDPLLPVTDGRKMVERMRECGAHVDYREYPMAHEVNRECLSDIVSWLG